MENKEFDTSLLKDKALAEAILGKENLVQWETQQVSETDSFFLAQQANILKRIQKKKAHIISLRNLGKIAIAASLLTIIATTYILVNKPTPVVATELVKIEEISSDEIENYVNANELIAATDWSSELNEEAAIYEASTMSSNTKNDSNTTD